MSSFEEDYVRGEGEEFAPAQTLLASVLQTALLDFARPGDSLRVRRYRENARRWLFGLPLPGDGVDFEQVCDALNLDANDVRRLALAGKTRLHSCDWTTRRHDRGLSRCRRGRPTTPDAKCCCGAAPRRRRQATRARDRSVSSAGRACACAATTTRAGRRCSNCSTPSSSSPKRIIFLSLV